MFVNCEFSNLYVYLNGLKRGDLICQNFGSHITFFHVRLPFNANIADDCLEIYGAH